MRHITKALSGAALALTLTAGAQVAVLYEDAPAQQTVHASWKFNPQSVAELRARAQTIVLAQVESVAAGPDIVTSQEGEATGSDRIPTRRITVDVVKAYKGSASTGQKLTLFQTGGVASQPAPPPAGGRAESRVPEMVLEGDPVYQEGEQYLLMLEPGPQGTLRPVSPEGRYRVDRRSGALTPMVQSDVARQVGSQRLDALEGSLRTS